MELPVAACVVTVNCEVPVPDVVAEAVFDGELVPILLIADTL